MFSENLLKDGGGIETLIKPQELTQIKSDEDYNKFIEDKVKTFKFTLEELLKL